MQARDAMIGGGACCCRGDPSRRVPLPLQRQRATNVARAGAICAVRSALSRSPRTPVCARTAPGCRDDYAYSPLILAVVMLLRSLASRLGRHT